MPKLIQKSGYVKSGGGGGYMKYIATRDGVELPDDNGPVTKQQQQLIGDLLRDFPDTRELYEYEDYRVAPSVCSASEFITAAVNANVESMRGTDGYMEYIATRPRAEKHGAHGLFSSAPEVSLERAMEEVDAHQGPVWKLIYSLKREDAARLGYDNAASWRQLIMAHQVELAEAMKIPPQDFRWYAAFHDEGHHPHIHMMVWSADPRHGYLTKNGIKSMRSTLTNEIFRDELLSLYQRKDVSYKEVVEAAQESMGRLIRQMESSLCDSPVIAEKMATLAGMLSGCKGKKVYGYLKKPAKEQVDSIVDELARLPEVAECYEAWNRLRDEMEGYYKREEMKILTREEMQRVLIQAREEGYYEVFLVEFATGLRLGELMALQWDDLDMATGELHINKQVVIVGNELTIAEPKTKAAVRTVILPPSVMKVLREYRAKTNSRWLFPSPRKEDAPILPSVVRQRLYKLLDHAGCKRVRFHDLRHLFSTNALAHGMDIKTLSTILGHESSATTLNIYAHVTDTMRKTAAIKIDQGIVKVEPQAEAKAEQATHSMTTFQAKKRWQKKTS